jgi:hypothetical protein
MKESITSQVGTAALGCPVEQRSTDFSGSDRKSMILAESRMFGMLRKVKECTGTFYATLREIFDESAYMRFLNRKQLVSSREAYAAFRQEYEVIKSRRPRCC